MADTQDRPYPDPDRRGALASSERADRSLPDLSEVPELGPLPHLRAVVDACAAAMVLLDETPRLRMVNEAYLELVGKQLGDLIGSGVQDLLPPEIALATTAEGARAHRAGALVIPEQICVDAVGNRRRVSWAVRRLPRGATADQATGRGIDYWVATGIDVTGARIAEATWRERAQTDPLTGLANRAAALAVLEAHLDRERGAGCAVLFCDLDRFKTVNDHHGHAAGDHVLQKVARRLTRAVRKGDLVARLGGDEFIVILPASGDIAARATATRLSQTVAAPIRFSGRTLTVGVSVGVRVADPGSAPASVTAAADAARYAHKKTRRAAASPPH